MQSPDNIPVSNKKPLGVLHRKLKKIKHKLICRISEVPEFYAAIQNYDGEYTDESIYEIIKSEYMQMLACGNGNKKAESVLKWTSKELTGDCTFWHKNINSSDIFFAKNLVNIDKTIAVRIYGVLEFRQALQNYNGDYTDEAVYEVLRDICLPKYLNYDIDTQLKHIMNQVSKRVTGSPVTWRKKE